MQACMTCEKVYREDASESLGQTGSLKSVKTRAPQLVVVAAGSPYVASDSVVASNISLAEQTVLTLSQVFGVAMVAFGAWLAWANGG